MSSLSELPGFRSGDLIPALGNGRCYGCHKPWYAADEPVSVGYGGGSGQFTMGRGCWARATVDERLEAHRWACDQWERMRIEDGVAPRGKLSVTVTWERIEQAIRADDLDMWRWT